MLRKEDKANDACGQECDGQLCSAVSMKSNEDPVGTAARNELYVFVEVPLPWGYDAMQAVHFPEGLKIILEKAKGEGRKFRFLSFASDALSQSGYRRVISYRQPRATFARYARTEFVVPDSKVGPLVEQLICEPEKLDQFAAFKADTGEDVRDLFVCTHGSHDVCCGKLGYPMYRLIAEQYAAASQGKLRVWRASHFGGHRFAPTVADFPEGRFWAHLEHADVDTIVHRNKPVAEIAQKYRGWSGMGKFEQMLEREAWIREGWNWIQYEKEGIVLGEDEQTVTVRIHYQSADGKVSGAYEGTIAAAGQAETGGCGKQPGTLPQFRVQHIVKQSD